MIVSTIFIPMASFLKKRFKVVNLFRFSALLFTIGTIIAGIGSSFNMLLIGRIIQGISNGIALPLMFSVILEQSPAERIGANIGIDSLVIAFAPAVGPVFGGMVESFLNWHYIFWLVLPLIIVSLVLGELSIQQESELVSEPFDVGGTISLAVFLITAILLVVKITSRDIGLIGAVLLLLFAVVSLIIFIVIDSNKAHPLLDLKLFKLASFDLFLVSFFLLQFMSLSMSYLIPNVLQIAFNQTASVAGMLVLPAAVTDALGAVLAGYIYDRTSPKLPILGGAILIVTTFILTMFIRVNPIVLMWFYTIFMIGLGLSYANIMTKSLSSLPKQFNVDDGNAIFMTAQAYSGALGIAVSASVLSLFQNSSQKALIVKETLNGLNANFGLLTATAVVVIGLLVCAFESLIKPNAKNHLQ